MEGIKSSVVLFTLLLAIFGPTVSFANSRTCFCKAWILPSGGSDDDGTDDIRVINVPNRVYSRSIYLGCSGPRKWCPEDCKEHVLSYLGGSSSTFTTAAINEACRIYGSPHQDITVLAKYEVSNCGTTGSVVAAEHVCCD